MIKSICILSGGYPYSTDPFFAFVEQIAVALSDKGIKVSVIAPQSITKRWFRGSKLHPKFRHYNERLGTYGIDVYQPYTISFGNRFQKINSIINKFVLKQVFLQLKERPEVCYGHFWNSGLGLFPYARKNNIPLIVACGESNVQAETQYNPNRIHDFLNYVNGVICVSLKNKEESIEAGFATSSKCTVIPNAVNPRLFHKKNKVALREKYGVNRDDFIVAYVGAFEHRKGSIRLSNALVSLEEFDIKSFFIGKGLDFRLEDPTCQGILFKGPLSHEILPDYLNMADVFCLPTLQEGCCNAIVEALACGLPVISSDKPFNYDILNESNSLLIDPLNEQEISCAIKELFVNKELRNKLEIGALESAKLLTIDERADRILEFIDQKIGK